MEGQSSLPIPPRQDEGPVAAAAFAALNRRIAQLVESNTQRLHASSAYQELRRLSIAGLSASAIFDCSCSEAWYVRQWQEDMAGNHGVSRPPSWTTRHLWQAMFGRVFCRALMEKYLPALQYMVAVWQLTIVSCRRPRHLARSINVTTLSFPNSPREHVAAPSPQTNRQVTGDTLCLARVGRLGYRQPVLNLADFGTLATGWRSLLWAVGVRQVLRRLRDECPSQVRAGIIGRSQLNFGALVLLGIDLQCARRATEVLTPQTLLTADERQPFPGTIRALAASQNLRCSSFPEADHQLTLLAPLTHDPAAAVADANVGTPPGWCWPLSVALPVYQQTGGQLLFLDQGQPESVLFHRWLVDLLDGGLLHSIVWRPHPAQCTWPLRYLIDRRIKVARIGDIHAAVHAASLVATHSSTGALAAAAQGKPILALSANGVPALLPLLASGRALWCPSKEALAAAVRGQRPAVSR